MPPYKTKSVGTDLRICPQVKPEAYLNASLQQAKLLNVSRHREIYWRNKKPPAVWGFGHLERSISSASLRSISAIS